MANKNFFTQKTLLSDKTVNSFTNNIVELETVFSCVSRKCPVSLRAEPNIQVAGIRLFRLQPLLRAISKVVINGLFKSLLKLFERFGFINQTGTNSDYFSGQKVVSKITVNRTFKSLVAKSADSHKYPMFFKEFTIFRMVPRPSTLLGCGREQKITSEEDFRETKRPCEPPLSPNQTKPKEANAEHSSSKVMSEGGGTFCSLVNLFSLLVIKVPQTNCVTNFSDKLKELQIFKLSGLCFLMVLCTSAQADDFDNLAKRCAPSVAADTLRAIVQTESNFNPYAIGVVGSSVKQPKSFQEAMSTIAALEQQGADYSVGIAQINKKNFSKLNINAMQALDACTNLKAAAVILSDCYAQAQRQGKSEKQSLNDALSCYYSGNFKTGYKHGYVEKVHKYAESVPSITRINQSFLPPVSDSVNDRKELSKLIF